MMPIAGRCDCLSPARCPRVDLCATELVVDLLVADPAPSIARCDVTLRCERPDLGAATQCPGPCPVDDRNGMSHLYDCCDAAPTEPHGPECGLSKTESGPGLTT